MDVIDVVPLGHYLVSLLNKFPIRACCNHKFHLSPQALTRLYTSSGVMQPTNNPIIISPLCHQDITTISPLYHHYIAIKPYQNDPECKCLNPSAPFVLIAVVFYHDLGPGPFADSPDHRHPWTWLPFALPVLPSCVNDHKCGDIMWIPSGISQAMPSWMGKMGHSRAQLVTSWMGGWHSMELWVPDVQTKLGFKQIQLLMSKKNLNFLPIENGAPEHECSSNRFNIFS